MIYTAREGVNTRHETIQSLMLKGLAIAFATSIAIFGAFAQNNDSTEANNQEPLAIYTAAPTDFGDATNPQGNGGSTQSTSGDTTGTSLDSSGNTAPQQQSRLTTVGSSSSGTQSSPVSSPLPVGGMGGGESSEEGSSCLCQQLQSTVNTQVSTVTTPLPPVPSPLP